jgi:hypothetical protein
MIPSIEAGFSASSSSGAQGGRIRDLVITDNSGKGGVLPALGTGQGWVAYVVLGVVALAVASLAFTWLKGKRG